MGKLRLSRKERLRLEVLSKVRKGGISLAKAAELLEGELSAGLADLATVRG